jgi:predicted amidophosphoribosyltransferase
VGVRAAHPAFIAIYSILPFFFDIEAVERAPGYCANCGYDLRGSTSGICSECGQQISALL